MVILAAADLAPDHVAPIRAFLALYLAGLNRADLRAHLPATIDRRMSDPDMTARHRELITLVRV